MKDATMALKNSVQLITYADSLGRNLAELHYVMNRYFRRALGGVHILPFYPSSADRGFAPITYDEVDARFGDWRDIRTIAAEYDLVVDFMVNHISRKSAYFQDFLKNGDASEYADMFLSHKKFHESGEIPSEDLAKVYTRKPRAPYVNIQHPNGSRDKVWCTFDEEQIDLDFRSALTRRHMRNFLIQLARNGAKLIRLDAFAYAIKKLGTNCFFVEPEVWELLDWCAKYPGAFGAEILPEIHEHYSIQEKIADHGYWSYDFALPMLTLNALYFGKRQYLSHWLSICPNKQITTLDTHDGIGVVDVADLLPQDQIDATVEYLYSRGSNANKRYSGEEYQNLDVYQINCAFYSALGRDDDAYIAARAIQFFAPGIPQVYYVGLLAGENDIKLVEQTKQGRDINRHSYTLSEIQAATERPVVKRLVRLMEFRNRHAAFDGGLDILDSPDHMLIMRRSHGAERATATIDLKRHTVGIEYTRSGSVDAMTL